MKILQKITVKQILTEQSKKSLLHSFEVSKRTLHKECDQLQFEMKKIEKNYKHSRQDVIAHFQKEMNIRNEKLKLLDFQVEQLNILPLGSELIENEVDAILDIEVGNSWDDMLKQKSIIIKDGIIVDIR